MTGMPPQTGQVPETLRRELFDEGVLIEGDSLGTDDETLL
jgi:hypothetical protein